MMGSENITNSHQFFLETQMWRFREQPDKVLQSGFTKSQGWRRARHHSDTLRAQDLRPGYPMRVGSFLDSSPTILTAPHFDRTFWLGDFPLEANTSLKMLQVRFFVPDFSSFNGVAPFKTTDAVGVQQIREAVNPHIERQLELTWELSGAGTMAIQPTEGFEVRTFQAYANPRNPRYMRAIDGYFNKDGTPVISHPHALDIIKRYSGEKQLRGFLTEKDFPDAFVQLDLNQGLPLLTLIDPVNKKIYDRIPPVVTLPGFTHSTRPLPNSNNLTLFVLKANMIRGDADN